MSKPLWALIALARLSACVSYVVGRQVSLQRESYSADITLEWFDLIVHNHSVCLQMDFLFEGIATGFARERFYSSVHEGVPGKLSFV